MMGFPFETITSSATRNQVMDAILDFFQAAVAPVINDVPDATITGFFSFSFPRDTSRFI